MITEQFKNLPEGKRKRALHAAINCNGRMFSGNDEAKYYQGRRVASTRPIGVMAHLIDKSRYWKTN